VDDLLDTGQRGQAGRVHATVVADQADGRALLARHGPGLVAELLDGIHDALDFILRRAVLHYNQHGQVPMTKRSPS
jgi:hypothetical protein